MLVGIHSPETWDDLTSGGVGAHGCHDAEHCCESVDAFCVGCHLFS